MTFAKKMKKMTAYISATLTLSLYGFQASAVESRSINTASIMAASVAPSCADYKVVGICYWLKCSLFGCSVKTSIKVHHFIPEMVVSVYNQSQQSPWTEMRWINPGVKGGADTSLLHNKKYTQSTFKNGEAFGHPGGMALSMLSKLGYTCESQTTPYVPYFLSGLDFLAWNYNMPEMFYPEAITPGMREVGRLGNQWGNLYPRSGTITQVHDYKASAVVAQRIGDIVSRNGQLHVYLPTARRGGKGKWYPKEIKEGDKKTHRWQMLSPQMSRSCSIFPTDGGFLDGHADKLSNQENYSWALWRPYACCKKQGQTFLGNSDWIKTHTQ